ncbi:MAG: trypsin-like peptidase domain-containing protein [Lachnospiraceae bacterium]|nr:trypsin-like peptidase domain-containing protein [Lachnospiraceae bacterium]
MKNRNVISIALAGVLTVGAVAGLTGFTSKETAVATSFSSESDTEESTTTLLTTVSDDSVTEESSSSTSSSGTLTVAEVAAKALPSVVTITNTSVTELENYYGGYYGYFYGYGSDSGETTTYESVSVGSGIIIGENDTELLILTNYHVVEDATELSVGFIDESAAEAVVKGTDASIDIAVVAVQLDDISSDTMSEIAIAEIGDSDSLQLGEQVVAIGNALGYGQSVTTGIVSALNRTIELDSYTAEMIQTDAAINAGNSGGPLLDMNGRVIGINSAKAADTGVEGMGYAIPISDVTSIIEDLMNKKTRTETVSEDESAYIGITGQEVSSEMSSVYGIPEGIYITEVAEDSPASAAGLQAGYIITKFDSTSVSSMTDLKNLLAYYAGGETVEIVVSYQSNGTYIEETIELTLGLLSDYQTESTDDSTGLDDSGNSERSGGRGSASGNN